MVTRGKPVVSPRPGTLPVALPGAGPAGTLRPFPHDLQAPGVVRPAYRTLSDRLGSGEVAVPAQPAGPDTLRLAILRVDFETDRSGTGSTGDGRFDLRSNVVGIPVDPPPHDRLYVETHAEALRRFYDVQSYGSLAIETTVFPADPQGAYRLSDLADYGPWEVSQDQEVITLAENFVEDAIAAADRSGEVDFASFDAFVVIHAGADFQGDINRDSPFDIPSFTITLFDSIPVDGGAFRVGRVLVLPETAAQDGRIAALNGVFAHEFGHILGLPDLYNILNGIPQVGYWSLMDSGENIPAIVFDPETEEEFLAEGIFPTSFDPWCKLQIFPEAVQLVPVEESWSAALEGGAASPILPLVEVDGFEYFLVENRALDLDGNGFPFVFQDSTTGVFLGPVDDPERPDTGGRLEYDSVLPGGGVLIWHIDDHLAAPGLVTGLVNLDLGYRGVALEEADGVWDQGRFNFGRPEDAFYLGNNERFGPDTVPSSAANDGARSGVTIEITSVPERFMGVSIERAYARDGWPVFVRRDAQVFTNLGPMVPVDLDRTGGRDILFYSENSNVQLPGLTRGLVSLGADGDPLSDVFFATFNTRPWPGFATSDRFVHGLGMADSTVIAGAAQSRVFLWDREGTNRLAGSSLPAAAGTPVLLSRSPEPGWILYPGLGTLQGVEVPGALVFSDSARTGVALPVAGPTLLPGVQSGLGPAVGLVPLMAAVAYAGGAVDFFVVEGDPARRPDLVRLGSDVRYLVSGVLGVSGSPLLLAITEDSAAVISAAPGEGVQAVWPLEAGVRIPPVVGDLDLDGRSECMAADTLGTILAWNGDGSPVLGWPRRVTAPVRDLKLVDLDGDQRLDVLVLDGAGRFHAWTGRGERLEDAPRAVPALQPVSAWIEDLDGDGRLTWVATTSDGALLAVRLPGAVAMPGDWRAPRGTPDGGGYQAVPSGPAPGVGPDLDDQPLLVYPNPARDGVEIRFVLDPGERADLQLLDLSGRVLSDARLDYRGGYRVGENAVRWDLDAVAPGLYLCRLERDAGTGARVDWARIVVVR